MSSCFASDGVPFVHRSLLELARRGHRTADEYREAIKVMSALTLLEGKYGTRSAEKRACAVVSFAARQRRAEAPAEEWTAELLHRHFTHAWSAERSFPQISAELWVKR